METIYIMNMVCDRCIMSVKKVFEKNGIIPLNVKLGEVKLNDHISMTSLAKIGDELKSQGFELIDSSTPVIVIKIKAAIVALFTQNEFPNKFKLSTFLTDKMPYDYSHLSRVFSHHEKDTIEHYLIKLRIEKAKELLAYKNQNVSEVAYRLGYSNAAHFSRQFKKRVGVPPIIYQRNPGERTSLEDF